jgi:acyl-CoA hydrolase/RimJ/RimL family protein N-acetyltransferase
MTTKVDYREKTITIDGVLDLIRPGDRIFLSSGPAIPALTVSEIFKTSSKNLLDLELIQLITLGEYLSISACADHQYRLKTFNVGESITKEFCDGKVDFVPANLIEIPFIFSTGAIGIDKAIVLTSPPDKRGYLSLGIAVDVADIAINSASTVIAEINPNMPVTHGETLIHMDQVDYIIESDMPLLERERKPFDSVQDRIGWHISNLIEDGSTVVLHVGRIFDAIAKNLISKRDLGIYTNVISDWVIDLIESGTISYKRSRFKGGQVTTSYCYGTKELYDYVDDNPLFEFYPLERLANPYTIRRISNLISIMNVKKIDISGEAVIFHSGDNLLTGYESKLNFAIGAAFSRMGKAIIALNSVDQEGNSNIVISHEEDRERVRATLGVTRYVVTEYGIANLFGKSIRERVLAMIDIAHPRHREDLLDLAKAYGYVYRDQIYIVTDAVNYPIELETVKTFKDGLEVVFRPIKPSDEDMMRRLFYHFSDESKYLRYFVRIMVMPHREMQKYVNIDYTSTLSIVGVLQKNRTERIIAEARYSYYEQEDSYEMAFIVDEEFQGCGIATFLLNYLLRIAKERGLNEIYASVLPENKAMLRVFNKADLVPQTRFRDGVIEVKYFL